MAMNEFQKQLDEKLAKAEIVPPKTFKITIEEHVVETFEVEATNLEEAMEIAEEKYYAGEFVLEPGDVAARLMQAEDEETNETTEWVEF